MELPSFGRTLKKAGLLVTFDAAPGHRAVQRRIPYQRGLRVTGGASFWRS